MKAYVCSDLHCEFHNDGGSRLITEVLPDADIAIVAGDLAVAKGLRETMALLAGRYAHVVYVAGNHEYYHSNLGEVEEIRRSLNLPNVHWLENQVAEIDGVRFVGCTLWFGRHRTELEGRLSDFHVIAGIRDWVHAKNAESLRFLDENVTAKSIVVTHHVPTVHSIAPRYRDSALNGFFVCLEAERILLERDPRLWIHGHTHDSFDYRLGRTRVVCNPLGYAGVEVNPLFKTDQAVMDVGLGSETHGRQHG